MKKLFNTRWTTFGVIILSGTLVVVFLVLPQARPTVKAKAETALYQTTQVQKVDLTATIGATGVVRSAQTTTLIWQTSGFVKKVNYSQGQSVTTNSILAELEQTSLPQTVILAQVELVAAQRALDDLEDSSSPQAQAQLVLSQAQKALNDAKQHRLNMSYRSTPDQVAAANANYIMAQNVVDDKQEAYDNVAGRPENDNVRAFALAALENAKKARDKALINVNWYKGKADPKDISEADAGVAVAQAKVEDAQREWDRLKNGADPQDLAAAQARVAAAQATLNLSRISAPFNGTLSLVNNKVGDQITPGFVAFQLDDLSHLYVDLAVSQADVNRIQVGQPVRLEVGSVSGKKYSGAVTQISPVGKSTAGNATFTVTVEVTRKGSEIRPGMILTATIAVSQVTNALFVPSSAIHTQNGQKIVYLLKSGTPIPVVVTLGTLSGSNIQVLSGQVQDGDQVIIHYPGQS